MKQRLRLDSRGNLRKWLGKRVGWQAFGYILDGRVWVHGYPAAFMLRPNQ